MKIPAHVAIIPDGNRRWARKHNLPDVEGHRVSAEKVLPKLIEALSNAGVQYFTFWALSTENAQKRSVEENSNLLGLMKFFLERRVNKLHEKNLRIQTIGNIEAYSEDIKALIAKAIDKTKNNTGMTVVFGVNYGGRDEIIRAMHAIESEGNVKEITKETFGKYLDTRNMPDPDLIIRTGGDKRISGFMLWQSEYAEFDFSDKLFPEYTPEDCNKAIQDFASRDRRFGS